MKITWIGQSGYVIKTEQAEIIIDPYLSDVVNRVAGRERLVEAPIKPEEIRADAVICTHNHLDHLDVDAIDEMDKTLLYITTREGELVLKNKGCTNVVAFREGESLQIKDVKLTAVYACHTVEAFGVVLQAEGLTLYFSGDTLYDEKLFAISRFLPDCTFICINGKLGNMNVAEAVITAKQIGAKINVPNHYGMFASNTEEPELFTGQIDNGFIMELGKEYGLEDIRS